MRYRLEFEIPGLPRMTNPSGRSSTHWRVIKTEADEWKRLVAVFARPKPPHPLKRAILTLTRVSSTAPDYDGLVSGFKHVIDGLVIAGVLENDKLVNIGVPNCLWDPGQPNKGKIRVKVEQMDDEYVHECFKRINLIKEAG